MEASMPYVRFIQSLTGLPYDLAYLIYLKTKTPPEKDSYSIVKYNQLGFIPHVGASAKMTRSLSNGHYFKLKESLILYVIRKNRYNIMKAIFEANNHVGLRPYYYYIMSDNMFKFVVKYMVHKKLSIVVMLNALVYGDMLWRLKYVARRINIFTGEYSSMYEYPIIRMAKGRCLEWLKQVRPPIRYGKMLKRVNNTKKPYLFKRTSYRTDIRDFYIGVIASCLQNGRYKTYLSYMTLFKKTDIINHISSNQKLKKKWNNLKLNFRSREMKSLSYLGKEKRRQFQMMIVNNMDTYILKKK